jgi:hypothetical protein
MACMSKKDVTTTRHLRLIVSLLLLCILLAPSAAAEPPSPSSTTMTTSIDSAEDEGGVRQIDASGIPGVHGLLSRDQQAPGSSCPGSEGQWNCMTTSWQRCAAGKWSVVMQCAAGTACVPAGLTYDFKVQFAGQGQGTGSRSSALRVTHRWLIWPLIAPVAAIAVTMLFT